MTTKVGFLTQAGPLQLRRPGKLVTLAGMSLALFSALVLPVFSPGGRGMGIAAAQPAMPDPSQMSGIPRQDPAVATGTITVRLIRGELTNRIVGTEVQLVSLQGGAEAKLAPRIEKTDAEGRATFTGVPVGSYEARAVVDTEALVAARAPTTTTRKVVALTFDDGPSASWTPYVLEILRSRGVRATFCMVGTAVEKAPEVAAQVVAAGHQVCNHTQSHDLGLAEADQARVDAEVQGGRATMLAAGLPEPPFYRPPGGNLSDPVIATARAQGERVLMWKVDTRDWSRSATVESVLANLRSQVEPGAIVLLHDAGGSNRFTSLAVLAGLIDELRAQGYDFTFPVIDPA